MKVFVSHSKNMNYEEELYQPIVNSALHTEYDFFLPHENDQKVDTKEEIKSSALVIAEVSLPATGQGVELGWANAFDVPILCVHREGVEISRSLKNICSDFIVYTHPNDLITKLEAFMLQSAHK